MANFIIIAASVLVLATVNCQQYYQQRGSAVPEQYYEEQQAQSYQPRQVAAQRAPIYQSSAGGQQVQPAILMHKQQLTHDGGFAYAFAADNGLKQGESIAPDGTRQGQYSYVDPNGKTISVKYTAGKDGFRILEGAHIPKAPQPIQQQAPVPQYQQQAAAVPQYQPQYQQSVGYQAPVSRAYGAQDDGQYRGEDSYQASGYSRPAASGYRPGPATFPPAPAYQPRYTQPRALQYKAPVSNSVQQEPDYNVDPGKPHSFGSGYSFEFAG